MLGCFDNLSAFERECRGRDISLCPRSGDFFFFSCFFAWTIELFFSVPAQAGSLEAIGKPSEPASAMYSLEEIHNRFHSGVTGSKRMGGFVGPAVPPGAVVGKTLNDVMAMTPKRNSNGARRDHVACGKVYWGLFVNWGPMIGTSGCPAPTQFKVTAAHNKQTFLSWDPVPGATAYHVYAAAQTGLNPYNYASLPGGMVRQNVSSPYTLTGLSNDMTYTVLVSAMTVGGEGVSLPVSATPVFVRLASNNNGTVTDYEKGLTLLQKVDCFATMTWTDALDAVAFLAHGQCGLTDNSTSGQWRLPTKDELAILSNAKASSTFTGVRTSSTYWSGTVETGKPTNAWSLNLGNGSVGSSGQTISNYFWPVRDMQ